MTRKQGNPEPQAINLDLTGPHSHILVKKPRLGKWNMRGVAIGPASPGEKVELVVTADEAINWRAFDGLIIGNNIPWPSWVKYSGADTGFFAWTRRRHIGDIEWTPILPADRIGAELAIDASESKIFFLTINMTGTVGRLHLTVSPDIGLIVKGDIARFSADGEMPHSLELVPRTAWRNTSSFMLPDMGALHRVSDLTLTNQPLRQPISLRCLRQFPNLKSLFLRGSFSDLEELAGCQLEKLFLLAVPDLSGLPALSTWPKLDGFTVLEVEQGAARRLRKEYKARAAVRPWKENSGFGVLRKPEWWQEKFGHPFSGWSPYRAKEARIAYEAALAELAKARSLAAAEAAFTTFMASLDRFKGMEPTEREDISDTLWQLSQSDHAKRLGVTEEMAERWFEQARPDLCAASA